MKTYSFRISYAKFTQKASTYCAARLDSVENARLCAEDIIHRSRIVRMVEIYDAHGNLLDFVVR